MGKLLGRTWSAVTHVVSWCFRGRDGRSSMDHCRNGPCVIRSFNFRLKSKIENWCQFLIFVIFYHKNTIVPNWKFLTFSLLIKYWNITYIFTLILSTIKRKMKLSGNFAFPTMLQSVAWLSIFVFGSLKNWKLKIAINLKFLFFGQNIQNRWQNCPRGRGRGLCAR